MTDFSHIVPALAIVVLVAGLVYLQRRLSRLEDREHVRRQQTQMNVQMKRFAGVAMRILGGEEAAAIASDVASAIVETTPFSKVGVGLLRGQAMELAGYAGLSSDEAEDLRAFLGETSISQIHTHSATARAVSHQSFQFPKHFMTATGRAWPREESIVVLVTSTRGTQEGVFILSGHNGRVPDGESMVCVELLAAQIAMSMENAVAKKRTFQSEKLEGMGQLVAGVAHELNNPLTAVLGYTEILTEKTNDSSVKYDLNVMRREALRMKRIIESLQQFSRKQRVEREKVNVRTIIEDTVASRADEIREQKIEVVKQIDPSLPAIVANQALIDQVFQHIFANAMDAVGKAGLKRILIEARALGDQVHIQVSDSGPGFKDVGRVFDPFYTTKGPGKGTGLGLSLCYGIIRDHGGEITASNLHPLGACISIQLPLVSLEARSQAPQAAAPVIR